MARIKRIKWELLFLIIGILLTVIARDYTVDHRLALGLDPSWGGEYLIIPLMLIIYAVIPYDEETGKELIDTEIENPIKSAERKDGVLYVELLNFIGFDATEAERYPDWIDHTEYSPPKADEANGTDEMEE